MVDSMTNFRLVTGRACSDLAWVPYQGKDPDHRWERGQLWLVGAGLPGAGGDADGVPGVDGHDEADQRPDLVRAELAASW